MEINFQRRNSRPRLKRLRALRLPTRLVGGAVGFIRLMGLLLILVCVCQVFAQESTPSGTEAAIRALEHEWVEGQSHNDNGALDLIFDNSLVYVEYGKLVSKGEYLARIKDAGPQLSQIVMEPMSVRTFGNTAIVIGTYRERDLSGQKPRLKRWRFVDTWVYKKQGMGTGRGGRVSSDRTTIVHSSRVLAAFLSALHAPQSDDPLNALHAARPDRERYLSPSAWLFRVRS